MNPIPVTYAVGSKLEQSLIERDVIIKLGISNGIYLNKNAAD
jgi:hypothetical protein